MVVGIGLNVNMPRADDIDQAWTDLARICAGHPPSRSRLLGTLLSELLPLLAAFETGGFAPWREPWCALDAYADAEVVLLSGEKKLAGIARGVDDRGALQLETASSGIQSIYGGELSMRPVP